MIKANSEILGCQSDYFGAMITRTQWISGRKRKGKWTESERNVVKVDLASEEGEHGNDMVVGGLRRAMLSDISALVIYLLFLLVT